MPRTVTLFGGQWADLPLDTFCAKAKSFGYDGVELACWGDHFEVDKALSDDGYCRSRWDILNQHGLQCEAISNHLVGQAVCDPSSTSGTRAFCRRTSGAMATPRACASAPPRR